MEKFLNLHDAQLLKKKKQYLDHLIIINMLL